MFELIIPAFLAWFIHFIYSKWSSPKTADDVKNRNFQKLFKNIKQSKSQYQSNAKSIVKSNKFLSESISHIKKDKESVEYWLKNVSESDVEAMLEWLFDNEGHNLEDVIPESHNVKDVISVYERHLPFEDLPEEVRDEIEIIKTYNIDNPIILTFIFVWTLSLMWMFRDGNYEASISLVNQLLAILMYIRETLK